MEKNEFQCAICKNIYEKGCSDEEIEKEVKEIWGEIPKNERVVLCDDCWKQKSMTEIKMGIEYKSNKK
jgi:uncharacterized CHY-type Zn-finger protein